MLISSLVSAMEFMYSTYLNPDHDSLTIYRLNIWEKIISVMFGFDWCVSLFIADHKVQFLTSFFSMIDILTVIPIWVTSNVECPAFADARGPKLLTIYVVCGMVTTRILRALRIHKWLAYIEDPVHRNVGDIALIIISLILYVSAIVQYLESDTQPHPFHTWMYFATVTVVRSNTHDSST